MFNPLDYSRRIADIKPGLEKLDVANSPNEAIRFLGYFFGCEKLATAMVGIQQKLPVGQAFRRGFQLKLEDVMCAVSEFRIAGLDRDIDSLFGSDGYSASQRTPVLEKLSARELRHKVVHHFGPTHVEFILKREPFFTPIMRNFLAYDLHVLRYVEIASGIISDPG